MSSTHVLVSVSYSQLAVFRAGLAQPFNDWTDKHVSQGFAWRPESVSFRTVVEAGPHDIDVVVSPDGIQPSADAVWIIEVPFKVPTGGAIEVASIADGALVNVPPGVYSLRFESFQPEGETASRVKLIFTENNRPKFCVIRSDQAQFLDGDLLTTASPA